MLILLSFFIRWAEKTAGSGLINDFRALDKIFFEEFNMQQHFPMANSSDKFPSIADLRPLDFAVNHHAKLRGFFVST